MNYGNAPSLAGGAVLPATGMALGSLWIVLAGITLLLLAFAVMRMVPRREV